jgi:hypothetical protein
MVEAERFERVLVSASPRRYMGEIDEGDDSDRAYIVTRVIAEQRRIKSRVMSRENTHRLPR